MNSRNSGVVLGLGMVAFGVLVLFRDFFGYYFVEEDIVSAGFVLASLFFATKYVSDKTAVWALVISAICAFVAFAVFAANNYYIEDEYIGVAALWMISGAFFIGFFRNKDAWGLLIPAGILFSVGCFLFAKTMMYWYYEEELLYILFLGFSATFGTLFFMKNETRKTGWAIIPSGIFLMLAAGFGLSMNFYWFEDVIFPAILISVGILLIVRNIMSRKKQEENNNQLEVQ